MTSSNEIIQKYPELKQGKQKANSIDQQQFLTLIVEALKIEILNPKALQLIKDMEELKLISIKETSTDAFMEIVKKLRTKAGKNPPTLEKISREVESVRTKRYAQKGK